MVQWSSFQKSELVSAFKGNFWQHKLCTFSNLDLVNPKITVAKPTNDGFMFKLGKQKKTTNYVYFSLYFLVHCS